MRGQRRSQQVSDEERAYAEMIAAEDGPPDRFEDRPSATPPVEEEAPVPTLTGTVRRVLFPRERTEWIEPKFAILSVYIQELRRNVTVKGLIPFLPNESDVLEIIGTVTQQPQRNNPDYMEDVIENAYVSQKVEFTEDSIRSWLERNISTVGPVKAGRIVRTLGGAQAINKFGERQAMIDAGLDDALATEIAQQYATNRAAIREFMFLNGLRGGGSRSILHAGQVKAIQAHFKGKGTIPAIKANPWILASIKGVGFETADKIGLNDMGFGAHSHQRIHAGTVHALREIGRSDGHTGVPEHLLVARASSRDILNVDPALISSMLIEMADEGIIVRDVFTGIGEEGDGRDPEINYTNTGLIFSKAAWDAEEAIANKIVAILSKPPYMEKEKATKIMEKAARIVGMRTLDPSQKHAIVMGLMYPALTVTGGPGTGKSTVQRILFTAINLYESRVEREKPMRSLISQWADSEDGPSYSLISAACPTGKGAVRLAEASGEHASTVHRQIGARKEGGCSFNADKPIPAAVVATDEFSMMDTETSMRQMVAIDSRASMVLIGDDNQLTSVGPGQVLRDIIDSGIMPTAKLGRTHRQGKESGIPVVAERILAGLYPFEEGEELRGCKHINVSDARAMDDILQLVSDDIVMQGLSPDTDIIVMSPMRNGAIGVVRCNNAIKNAINPITDDPTTHPFELAENGTELTINDVVMNLENNDAIQVMNGECGIVSSFTKVPELNKEGNPTGRMLDTPVIDFGSGDVIFPPDKLHKLAIANAGTVHKNQGSENTIAIMIIPSHAAHMTSKNLFFTGLTRGKIGAYIVGSAESLMKAVNNISATNRYTGLKHKLISRRPELIQNLERLNADTQYLIDNMALVREREATAAMVRERANIGAKAPQWAIRQTKQLVRQPPHMANRAGPPPGVRVINPNGQAPRGGALPPSRGASLPPARGASLPPARGGGIGAAPAAGGNMPPARGGAILPARGGPMTPARGQALPPARGGAPAPQGRSNAENPPAAPSRGGAVPSCGGSIPSRGGTPGMAPRSAAHPPARTSAAPIPPRGAAPPGRSSMPPARGITPLQSRQPTTSRIVPTRPIITSRAAPKPPEPSTPAQSAPPSTPAGVNRVPEPPPPPPADSQVTAVKNTSPAASGTPQVRRITPPPRALGSRLPPPRMTIGPKP